jgi:ferric-dicitrate binding protein FerR (iron transport regulator)
MEPFNQDDRLSELERKWAHGTITESEAAEYADWYNQGQDEPVVIPAYFAGSEQEHQARLFRRIELEVMRTPCLIMRRTVIAAAVLLIIVGCTLYYMSDQMRHNKAAVAGPGIEKTEISPGRTKASLRLGNGQIVILDSAKDGLIAQQGAVNVLMSGGGLTYEKNGRQTNMTYNTLYTHNGEQYSLTLSDGTKVWLNAASYLHFPVAFTGRERRVEVSGEAYFEVANDPGRPFYVNSGGQEIKVLGTHFNINAYTNERIIETTLLEGKIRVNEKVILLPGQQSRVRNGAIDTRRKVDIDAVVAWKNGRFNFDNADISVIMRQLERWYDIQVVFQGSKTIDLFYGTIPRSASLEQVLRMLENNRVHYTLQGRRLTILP